MKSVLYIRVSSKEQEESGYSLPAQKKLLKDYALKHNLAIVKTFSISESASGCKQRTIFKEMINHVSDKKINVIICEKADRLTRNLKDAVEIDEWLERNDDRQIHLVKDNIVLHRNSRSQEKLNWGIRVILAKNYTDNLSEEVKKGQIEKLNQGWLPQRPPLGYKTVGDQGRKIHVIDKEISPHIKKLYELYATGGYSLKKLVDVMYKEGFRSQKGKKLGKSRLAEALSNPFYCGHNRWHGKVYPVPGKQECIVSKQLFDIVQDKLHSKTTPKYRKHLYLFKGLIKCAECKGTITWEKQKGTIYGHCNHRYSKCSQKTWAKEHMIEKDIIRSIQSFKVNNKRLSRWIHKALLESHKDKIAYQSNTKKKLTKKIDEIDRWLDMIYDDKIKGLITQDKYTQKLSEYSAEKEIVLHQLEELAEANKEYFMLGAQFYDISQKSTHTYTNSTLNEKRKMIAMMFQDMILDNGKISYHHTPPYECLLKAIAATNRSKPEEVVRRCNKKFERLKSGSQSNKVKNCQKFELLLARSDLN